MHHLQLQDPEPHDLLEPSSMSYSPQSTQRALIAWTHLGKKNNFQDVCNYYQRLEKLEETFPRQQMTASRMLEYKLIENYPPKSMLQHKMFPNLYPHTREYKPFGERNVITIKDRAKAREPTTAADIQAANKMIKTYCAFRETTPKKLIQEFRQYSMANGVEQTVSNVAFFVQHKMILVIKQIEAKLNAEKNFNYSGCVDPDVNTEGDEHEEVYDNYGITPEQNSTNNGNTAFINSLLDNDDNVKNVEPIMEKTTKKGVSSAINPVTEDKPKLLEIVNDVATKASVPLLQYSHVVQNGTKYVMKTTAVNPREALVNEDNHLHTESTNRFDNQTNSKTETRTNAIEIVDPSTVKKNKKSKGKDTVANNIEKNVTKLIEKFEKVTTNESITVKKEVPKMTLKNKVSAADSPQTENCKSLTVNKNTPVQGKPIDDSNTRQPLVEITEAINNENSSVEASIIEPEVDIKNKSKTQTVSQDSPNLSDSVQKMAENLMGVKKYFLEHQMDIDIDQIMKSFFEKRKTNKTKEPKFSSDPISQMQEEVDEIYNKISELSYDLIEDQNNNSHGDNSVEQAKTKSESIKNRVSEIFEDITKNINKLNISIEKEEMKRMSKKERKAWKKCKKNARKVIANENRRHSRSVSVELNDSSLSFKSLPSEKLNRSFRNESNRKIDDDFLFDCEPIVVDPDCSLADTSNLSEDFKSLNRKRFSTSSQ